MADPDKDLDVLSEMDRARLKELMEKDARPERRVAGPWLWLTSGLSAAMVLVYFYGAGYQALSTEYHLGVYVLITFVLVFLLYSPGARIYVIAMSVISAALIATAISCSLLMKPLT